MAAGWKALFAGWRFKGAGVSEAGFAPSVHRLRIGMSPIALPYPAAFRSFIIGSIESSVSACGN